MANSKDRSCTVTVANGAALERRVDELTVSNLASHDATAEENDSSFCINLAQQERVHLAETADFNKRNHADMAEKADIQDLSKLYKADLASSAPPLKRFLTVSSVNEPFRLLAKEAMARSGIDEGSLEANELRTAGSDFVTPSDEIVDASIDVLVSADQSSVISCDPESAGDELEFEQAAAQQREQMDWSRNRSDGLRIANSARLRARHSRRDVPGAKR